PPGIPGPRDPARVASCRRLARYLPAGQALPHLRTPVDRSVAGPPPSRIGAHAFLSGRAAALMVPLAPRRRARAVVACARPSGRRRPLYNRFKSGIAGGFRRPAYDDRYFRSKQGFTELGVAAHRESAIPKYSRAGPAYWEMTLISLRAGEVPGLTG